MAIRMSEQRAISRPRERDRGGTDVRGPGVLFVGAGAAFLTGIMVAASIAPRYDYHSAAISDLGVTDETAVIFNALLIVVGVLNIAGGVLFYEAHRRRLLMAVYLVGGVGAVGAGLLPLDSGAPHALFALLGFLFFNIEAIATARIVAGPMRTVSVVAGVVGLLFVVIMVIGDGGNPAVFGPIGHGGSERMIVYPAMLWLLTFGGYLIAREPSERWT
jgi:hypothetical membrane protein